MVGVLAAMQKLDGEQISNIVSYELPLSRLISEFDVGTDRYELNIMRMLRLNTISPDELRAAASTQQTLTDGLRKDVDAIQLLVQRAIDDPRYRTEDRVDLARIEGSFKYIVRNLDGFLAVGEQTMGRLADGKGNEAKTASLGFDKYAQAFGPDLAEIRRGLASLTERATRSVLTRQQLNTYLSFALFIAACGIGLGISAVGSAQAVSGLRQLVASARAIASGANSEPVVILTRDEVGELARSFNFMVEELRSREHIKDTFGNSLILASSTSLSETERTSLSAVRSPYFSPTSLTSAASASSSPQAPSSTC